MSQAETLHIQLAASEIVQSVLSGGRNLNQVLDEILSNKSSWTPAQRAALQDLSFGTLRFYGQLNAVLNALLHKPLTEPGIKFLLLVALYHLQYGKSAQYAVVDHAVRAAQKLSRHAGGLVNAILRNFLRNQPALLEQAARQPEGKFSYPAWWITMLQAQYGENSAEIMQAGNQHPPMTLRVNQRHVTTAEYQAMLTVGNLSAQRIAPDALLLDKPVPVNQLPKFYEGWASVQDAGAQYAAILLDAQEGMSVLDACAAPGGKTAHILERANVSLLAVDKDEKRLSRVHENLQRLQLNAATRVGDAQHPEQWSDGKLFDRILADVPCSASGVVRRHPDIKWLRRPVDIANFATQQLAILQALWRVLAQDGKLLYATCSVFQQENEHVITTFLSLTNNARRLPITLFNDSNGQLLPNDQHDGFFYALLLKQKAEGR